MLKRLEIDVRSRWPEWFTLFVYTVVLVFAIPYHEPWADEAQPWQLARSLSLPALFQTYIRYEASPGLWHFLLWILVRADVTYTGMHWICGAVAVAATALLVFKSPFPRYLKLILPFTSFLLFQYAVVARSYVLVPYLLFLIALCWKRSPMILALLLGLLANVALHASVISGGLALAYVIEQTRNGTIKAPHRRRQLLWGSLVLLALWAFALWTAWPPKDLADHIASVRGPSRSILLSAIVSLVWGIFSPWELSIVFWIAIAFQLGNRNSLFFLLPVLLFAAFSGAVHFEWWHIGLLVPLLICILWITWPDQRDHVNRIESIGRFAVLGMAAVQILWSAYALKFDHFNAYSPDLETAQFLRPIVLRGGKIALTCFDNPTAKGLDTASIYYRSVGLLPYFDHNIFINEPDSFWSWNPRNRTAILFNGVLPSKPAVVVVEMRTPSLDSQFDPLDPNLELLTRTGYRFTHMFCGDMPIGFRMVERSCHFIFQRMEVTP